jgi:hypothetical protein
MMMELKEPPDIVPWIEPLRPDWASFQVPVTESPLWVRAIVIEDDWFAPEDGWYDPVVPVEVCVT